MEATITIPNVLTFTGDVRSHVRKGGNGRPVLILDRLITEAGLSTNAYYLTSLEQNLREEIRKVEGYPRKISATLKLNGLVYNLHGCGFGFASNYFNNTVSMAVEYETISPAYAKYKILDDLMESIRAELDDSFEESDIWPDNIWKAYASTMEQTGKISSSMLNYDHTDYAKKDVGDELIKSIAALARYWISLDKYKPDSDLCHEQYSIDSDLDFKYDDDL